MTDHQQNLCTNCNNSLYGEYCSKCGQRHIGERLTLKLFLRQAFEAFTEVDSRLWTTLWGLTSNPGKVALNYVSGNRAKYINPLKYLLVTSAIYFALLAISGANESFLDETFQLNGIERSEKADQTKLEKAFITVFSTQMNLVLMVSILPTALLMRIQYFRSKKNIPELLSFLSFNIAHANMLFIPILLIMWMFGSFSSWFQIPIIVYLLFYGCKVFFNMRWPIAILAAFLTLLLQSIGMAFASLLMAAINSHFL